jgi:heme exporter protein C
VVEPRAVAADRHRRGLGPGLAPPDYQQGNSFRIIYIHVPAAMLAQSCYVMLAVCGVVGLVWKMKLADVALQCAAPIGAWMTAVALVTGAIWGKPTWGSWWVGCATNVHADSAVSVLRSDCAGQRHQQSRQRRQGLRGAGDCRRDQHPDHQVLGGVVEHPAPGRHLHPHRKTGDARGNVAAADGAGFYCFFGAVLLLRMRLEVLKREARASWVKAEVQTSLGARG